MNLPSELRYKTTHEWVRLEADGSITVGITDHAQDLLGDLVFIQLPECQRICTMDEAVAAVESVKTASDVHAPVSGEIIALNTAVTDAPEQLNQDSYTAWLFKMRPSQPAELDTLLNAAEYKRTVDAG